MFAPIVFVAGLLENLFLRFRIQCYQSASRLYAGVTPDKTDNIAIQLESLRTE
jgi:hypothetical protein